MKEIKSRIEKLIADIREEVIELRRDFHQHPELGFEEVETSKKVASYLRDCGLEVETGIAKTGVVGILKGEKPGPVIALRADMDALPVEEKTGFEYCSKEEGKMHACGHDGHTSILLGTARILSKLKSELQGSVKFIFQPAEEGPGGALPMIDEGVLKNPDVDAIFGLHLWHGFELGEVILNNGPMMAAPDEFVLKIKGAGGHGSAPHETVDAITISAQIINGLQQISSRHIDPADPVVVSVGTIKGGYKHNVIADEVEMTGTVRSFSPEVRDEVPKRMEEIVKGITSAHRGDYDFDFTQLYPPVVNDDEMINLISEVSNGLSMGVRHMEKPIMGGEDFAYFLKEVPGAFFRLGFGKESEYSYPLHHSQFAFNEEVIFHGIKLFTNLVFTYDKART